MATITVYGGDFKAGRGIYEFKTFRLKSDRQLFFSEVISLDRLAKLETVSLENNGRDTLSTAGRALVGELIAGPFGALVAAGTAKGRNQVTFHATFDDNRQFLGTTNSETFKGWMGALLTRQRMGATIVTQDAGSPRRITHALVAAAISIAIIAIVNGLSQTPPQQMSARAEAVRPEQQQQASAVKLTEAEIDAECNSVSDPIPNCKEELPKLLAKQAALPKLAPEPQDKGDSGSPPTTTSDTATSDQASHVMDDVNSEVISDAKRQYQIASSSGSDVDRCVEAGIVAAAYLQAHNQPDYQSWKIREEMDCHR